MHEIYNKPYGREGEGREVRGILKVMTHGENLCWYYYDEYNSINLIINPLTH